MNLSHRICAALCAATALIGAASAAPPALTRVGDVNEAARPHGVPIDYVVTPNGLFHPSCVGRLEEDETLSIQGDVIRPDGSRVKATACPYPRFNALGEQPQFNGWIAASDSDANVTPPAKKMVATFVVPSGPTAHVGQVLYYFPGLEDGQGVQTILQPVLAWNGFNDSAWTMTNWNCCKNGKTWHGPSISVATGHKIHGTMKGSNCSGSSCTNWQIASADKTTGQKTKFNTESYGQAFTWYFGGAKEAYFVSQCSHFPANGSIQFTGIHVYDMNGVESTPANWGSFVSGAAPSCSYVVTTTPQTTKITFNTSP